MPASVLSGNLDAASLRLRGSLRVWKRQAKRTIELSVGKSGTPLSAQMIFQDPYASLNARWRVFDIIAEPLRELSLLNSPQELLRVSANY